VTLAETLGSVGANCVVDGSRFYCVGQEINANHLRAVRSGRVTAPLARPHRYAIPGLGSPHRDEKGKLACISRITLAVVERTPPSLTGSARP